MIRKIVKDNERLMKKAVEATKEDLYVIEDMVDTAKANEEICVGLAANQIGETARIIVVKMGEYFIPLVNPKIVKHSQATYEVEEACLSHEGTRKTTRYASIEVE
ncbi:MAG: peptide deformylase, partial [Niameybacter sp.]